MSDVPPLARRATPKTVRVRQADVTPEPNDEPTGPPRVLAWFRVGCAVVASLALVVACLAAGRCVEEGWSRYPLLLLAGMLLVFVAYSLPLWWRRPRWWHWVYGLALLLPGVVPFPNPASVALLVFWFGSRTVRFFRTPPPAYAAAPPALADGVAAPTEVPAVVFPFRLLCVFGFVACLTGMPLAVALHSLDKTPGWGVLWWLGGFAFGGVLFLLPLLVRSRRPWVWWYGLLLLALAALTGYLTLLAVPVLVAWSLKGVRGYYGLSSPRASRASEVVVARDARGEQPDAL